MRIVVASRSTLGHQMGGMETYIDNQIDELRRLGHEVVLLTSPGISQEYSNRLSLGGVTVDHVQGSDSLRYSASWHTRIQQAVDYLEPNCVIFHGVAGSSYVPTKRVSAITLTHGSALISLYNSSRGKRPVRSTLSRALSFWSHGEWINLRRHKLVALSDFDAKLTAFVTLQSRSKIAVIPPAIALQRSERDRSKTVVFGGRIETAKGIETILSIWRDIDSNGHELVVAGSGSQLQRLRDEFEGANQVTFLGALSRAELARLLGSARWSVSGGRLMESFGLAVAESLASGTPVVFPRRGALPETAGAAGISYRTEKELRAALQSAVKATETEWKELHHRAQIRSGDFSPGRALDMWDKLLSGTQK